MDLRWRAGLLKRRLRRARLLKLRRCARRLIGWLRRALLLKLLRRTGRLIGWLRRALLLKLMLLGRLWFRHRDGAMPGSRGSPVHP